MHRYHMKTFLVSGQKNAKKTSKRDRFIQMFIYWVAHYIFFWYTLTAQHENYNFLSPNIFFYSVC